MLPASPLVQSVVSPKGILFTGCFLRAYIIHGHPV